MRQGEWFITTVHFRWFAKIIRKIGEENHLEIL